jgi:hypothetical protein
MYYRLVAFMLIVLSLVIGWLLAVPKRPVNVPAHSPEDAETGDDAAEAAVVDVEAEEPLT